MVDYSTVEINPHNHNELMTVLKDQREYWLAEMRRLEACDPKGFWLSQNYWRATHFADTLRIVMVKLDVAHAYKNGVM